MIEVGTARAQRPGLAVALPLILAAAVGGSHLLGEWLATRDQRLQHNCLVSGRAANLDLVRRLGSAARGRVLAALGRELRRAPAAGRVLGLAGQACARPQSEACGRVVQRLEEWQQETRVAALWSLGWQVGLMAVLALATVILGWLTVRHARGRLAGLALMGAVLVVAGAGWRANELFKEREARRRSFSRDVGVGRGRLAVNLPGPPRAAELKQIVGRLEQDGAPAPLIRELREAAQECGRQRARCSRVLIPLGRIHAANRELPPASRIRRWLNRWLMWSGAVFLLLVALVSAARFGGSPRPGRPDGQVGG